MPAVVTYWQLPEEEQAFLDHLHSTGTVMALPDYWVKSRAEALPVPLDRFIHDHEVTSLLIGLEKHARNALVRSEEIGLEDRVRRALLRPEQRDGHEFFSIPAMPSCVLMYTRPTYSPDKKLHRSNLAAYWAYPEDNRMVEKDPEFVKWAKKVLAWARRATPERVECRGYPYRATKKVKTAVTEGRLEVEL